MNQRTGVALIGLGLVSSVYVDALAKLQDRIRLVGVYARSESTRRDFLTKISAAFPDDCRAYPSVAAIANDPAVAFVLLTTPPNARREIVTTLAEAGKHILMEKPVERTFPAAEALCKICERAGVQLGIVFQHRFRPSVAKLRAVLACGDLGRIYAVRATVPWWRDQAYYDEPGRGTYDRDGGGVLICQAIHTLDLMLSLAGPVADVIAMTATTECHAIEAEDFVSAGLRFQNGALGAVFATTAGFPGQPETIALHCQHGSAFLESNQLTLNWKDGRKEEFGTVTASGASADSMAFTSDWHKAVIEDFDDAFRSGRDPRATGRSGLEVHQLIEAIERSGKRGCRVSISVRQ